MVHYLRFYWLNVRAFYRWLHCDEPPWLAMDAMSYRNVGFCRCGTELDLCTRNQCSSYLAKKAAKLRRLTKNYAIHAKQEEAEVNLGEMVERYFMRPFRMLVVEPIVLLMRYVHATHILSLSTVNFFPLSLASTLHSSTAFYISFSPHIPKSSKEFTACGLASADFQSWVLYLAGL